MNWKKFCLFISLIAISGLLFGSAAAQAKIGESRRYSPDKPQPYESRIHSTDPSHLQQDASGRWIWRDGNRPTQNSIDSMVSTGGPDEYGYTWDDSLSVNWIDASGGMEYRYTGK